MRRLILITFFLLFSFVFFGSQSEAEAGLHTDYMRATLDNASGTIPMRVYFYFTKQTVVDGSVTGESTFGNGNRDLAAGGVISDSTLASVSHNNDTEGGANYKMTWWTSCLDPTDEWETVELDDGTGDFTYGFGSKNVVCRTTNGEPSITSISCPSPGNSLSFNWQMVGGGPYNVAKYHLFRSQEPDSNPDDNFVETINTSSASGSKTWGGMTPGVRYYVRVSAESPQGLFSDRSYSNVVCQAPAASPSPTPAGQPNIRVTGFSVSPSSVNVNQNIQATVTVANNGTANAGGFQVAWGRGGVPGDCNSSTEARSVGSLAQGSSTTITFNPFSAGSSTGTFSAGVFADCNNAISESNEGDNTATAQYTVNAGVASPAPSAAASPAASAAPGNAVLNVRSSPVTGAGVTGGQAGTSGTTNYTASLSTNISTSLYVTSTPSGYSFSSWSGCDSVDGVFCIIGLATGNSRTVTANLTGSGPEPPSPEPSSEPPLPGINQIALSVGGCSGGQAPILIEWSVASSGTYRVVVRNSKVATVYNQLHSGGGSAWTGVLPDETYNGILQDPSSNTVATSNQVTVNCGGPPGGNNTINVRSSPFTGVPIADPRSGTYNTNYSWSSTSAIGGWFVAPANHNGESFINWSGCDEIWSSDAKWCSSGASGGQRKTITANYSGTPPEPTSRPRNDPDLIIESTSYSPTDLQPGGIATIRGVVANIGNAQAGICYLPPTNPECFIKHQLRIDHDSDGDWDVVPLNYVNFPIPEGETRDISWWLVFWPMPKGAHTYEICADATNVVYESDEFNNCINDRVFVGVSPPSPPGVASPAPSPSPGASPPAFPSPSPSAVPSPPLLPARIIGSKWALIEALPFDTANGLAGDTVRLDGGAQIDGPETADYAFNVTPGDHTVAVDGVPGYRVYWMTDFGPPGPISAPGAGTSVTLSVAPSSENNVWFYFENQALVVPSPSPSPSAAPSPPPLPDLTVSSISFDKDPSPTYKPGESVVATITVDNVGTDVAGNVNARFFDDLPTPPDCSTAPITDQADLGPLPPGSSVTWGPFTFVPPQTAGDKTARVLVGCDISQNNTANDSRLKTYHIKVGAWFETREGDVGTHGAIKISETPLDPNKFQSTYLVVGKQVDQSVKSDPRGGFEGWRINNYPGPLVPSVGIYNFLAERFKEAAIGEADAAGQRQCGITAGPHNDFWYCDSNATFGASGNISGNSVWFIDGDLNIDRDLRLAGPGDTVTFIVAGDILVDSGVNRIDGIYIAGNTFDNADGAGILTVDRTFEVNGAVYADNRVNLGRILSNQASCITTTCNNREHPAERIVYDPKYLVGLNAILGSPSLSWREVAP